MPHISRRDLLKGSAVAALAGGSVAQAGSVSGHLPWQPDAGDPPKAALPGPWLYFTAAEAAVIESLADHIIPPDSDTPGGKDAGCAVFIDRQLAGPYGRAEGLYESGPFIVGTKTQGPQSARTPRQLYRDGLTALEGYCQSQDAKRWLELAADRREAILHGIEDGGIAFDGIDARTFFKHCINDVQQGFLADPIYGGNRDMCGWKMIGFPGTRYDYRDWVGRHNERYPHPPVSMLGRRDWLPKS